MIGGKHEYEKSKHEHIKKNNDDAKRNVAKSGNITNLISNYAGILQ